MANKELKVGNVPNLRFPGFEGQWKAKKLGEIAAIGRGKSKHRPRDAEFLFGGRYPFIQTGDIRKADLYLTKFTQTYSEAGLKQSKLWDENTLCITIAANIAETAILKIKACFPDSVIGLIPKQDQAIVLFVKHLFDKFKVEIQNLSQGAAQDNLNQEKISKIQFSFPSIVEQGKIASFLSIIDERITTQNKIIEQLETLIKGLSEKLFSQKIRFKEFKDEWELKSLGEIGEPFSGLSGKTKDNFGKGKRYIQYKQIFDSSIVQIENCGLVEILENESQNNVRYGDAFFTISSETPDEIGMSSVILEEISEMYLNSFCFGFRAFSLQTLNPLFASYLFRNLVFRKQIVRLAQGSTRYNISKGGLMKLTILLPCLEEQIIMAQFLSSIDKKIQIEKKMLDKFHFQKQHFLQNLFI